MPQEEKRPREEARKNEAILSSQEQLEFGRKVAESLLEEINIPEEVGRSPIDKQLMKEVPGRDNFNFIITKGEDLAKVKITSVDEPVGQQELGKERFAVCFASGFFGAGKFFDVDHVFPFEEIKQRQGALINYLNKPENLVFAKSFMGIDPANPTHRQKIENFFGCCLKEDLEKKDKRFPDMQSTDFLGRQEICIRGKGCFFRLVFNDLKNLLPLAHPVNISKGSREIGKADRKTRMTWIQEQPMLGEQCWGDLTSDGKNIHDGVVMQKIFNDEGCKKIRIGSYPKGGEIEITVHSGIQVEGLGEAIKSWFDMRYPDYGNLVARIYTEVWEEMQELAKQDINAPSHKREIEKLTLLLSITIDTAKEYYDRMKEKGFDVVKPASDSDSDDAKAGEARKDVTRKSTDKNLNYMHRTKKMYAEMISRSNVTEHEALEVSQYFVELGVWDWQGINQKQFFEEVSQQLKRKPEGQFFSKDELKGLLAGVKQQTDPNMRADAAEARAQAAEKELATLRRQLAARQAGAAASNHGFTPAVPGSDNTVPSYELRGATGHNWPTDDERNASTQSKTGDQRPNSPSPK